MRAETREVPPHLLDERARFGADRWDEMWAGVLHMPPAPSREHQRIGTQLVAFLADVLARRGIEVQYETEVHRPGWGGKDFRIPDLVAFRPDQPGLTLTHRGLEGPALLAVEIRSPDDEAYGKLPFYAAVGIADVVVIEPPTRAVHVFRLASSAYVRVTPDAGGRLLAASVDVTFTTVAGDPPVLRVACGEAARDV